MKKTTFGLMPVLLALSMAPALQGCSDVEVAAAVGAVAGAAVGVAVATDPRTGETRCVGGYRRVCHDFRDYWGRIQTECRDEWDSCRDVVRVWSLDKNQAASATSPTDAAVTLNMSFDSAEKLMGALKKAEDKDVSGWSDLGLGMDDVKQMAKFELPSDAGLNSMSQALNQDKAATKGMLENLLKIAQEQNAKQ